MADDTQAASTIAGSTASGAGTGASVGGGWGALIGGGIGLASGIAQAVGASSAADSAAAAQQRALEIEQAQRAQNTANAAPWLSAGTDALAKYRSMAAGLQQPGFNYQQPDFNFNTYTDPGANYAMQSAMQEINESGLARGAVGGGTIKAIANQVNDIAQNNYANSFQKYLAKSNLSQGQAESQYNRNLDFTKLGLGLQQNISDNGLQATGALASANNPLTGQMANSAAGIGAAQAAGSAGVGTGIANGLNSLSSSLMKMYGYNQGQQQPATTGVN